MTIYADVLVGLNILITYITIVASRLVLKIPTNKYAVALSSVIGGLASLVIFFEVSAFASVAFRVACAAVIVFIGFLPKKADIFIKSYLIFFFITFLFGGAMLGLSLLKPQSILYANSTVYFNMSFSYLIGSILSVYGVFTLVNFILEKRTFENELCRVQIFFRDNSIELTGFVDTGNNLFEGISGRSVIVAPFASVCPLFNFGEREFLKSGAIEQIPQSLAKTIRLVPYKSIGGDGLMVCFAADKVNVISKTKIYEDVYCVVGVSSSRLSSGTDKVILNKNIFNVQGKEIGNENTV